MVLSPQVQQNDGSRVWTILNGAGPSRAPIYEGLARAQTPEDPRGDVTAIYLPDPESYGRFKVIGIVKGERGLPSLGVQWWYTTDGRSVHDRLVKNGCPSDIHVHMGTCQDPQDFDLGWKKILVLRAGQPTSWTTSGDIGALMPEDRSSVIEEIPFTGQEIFHIYPLTFQQQAAVNIVQEIIDVEICDGVSCGLCSPTSDGCQTVFALTLTNAGSPGLPPELIFSTDGGGVWTERSVTTLAVNEDGNALACIGGNLVIISEDSESLHYAPISDILISSEVWTEVATGFVATNGPLAIWSGAPRNTWIVGENGYVYFTADPTSGVTVQSPGDITTEDLNCVHGFDINNVFAVGANNALLLSRNGTTWTSIVGPNVGVALTACWMSGPNLWWVGDAGGQLWYTDDGGATWTEKLHPGSGTGQIDAIAFSNDTVGYLARRNATPNGFLLRTINGGNSWYVLPEAVGQTLPASDRLNAIAACTDDVNTVYTGGLGDAGTDGILIKGVGPSS